MNKAANRYELFARAYIVDLNATRAAITAGYSQKTAESTGSRLLRISKVAKLIAALQKKQCDKLEITAERVLREIGLSAFANMDDYLRIDGGKRVLDTIKPTRDQMAAVQEITEDTTGGQGDGERKAVMRTKFRLYDKVRSLELLGRHLKLFTDKVELSGVEGLADKLSRIRQAKNAG